MDNADLSNLKIKEPEVVGEAQGAYLF